jgi:hypothetical protein
VIWLPLALAETLLVLVWALMLTASPLATSAALFPATTQ